MKHFVKQDFSGRHSEQYNPKKTWLPNGSLGFFGHLSNLFIVINLSEAVLVGPESVISTFPLQDVPGVLLSPVRGYPGFP